VELRSKVASESYILVTLLGLDPVTTVVTLSKLAPTNASSQHKATVAVARYGKSIISEEAPVAALSPCN